MKSFFVKIQYHPDALRLSFFLPVLTDVIMLCKVKLTLTSVV